MLWLLLLAAGGLAVAVAADDDDDEPLPQTEVTITREQWLVSQFGQSSAGDYPAPYSYSHARDIADWLLRVSRENAPKWAAIYADLVAKRNAIDAAELGAGDKVVALIWGVIIPALAWHMPWWWYRPKSKQKQEQIAAVAMWLGFFFVGPQTATAARTVEGPRVAGTSVPPVSYAPVSLPPLKRGLSAAEQRFALQDVHHTIRATICAAWGSTWDCQAFAPQASARFAALSNAYPTDAPADRIEAGNLKAIDEIVWAVVVLHEAEVQAPDVTAMAWGMVFNAIAVVLAAVAPMAAAALAGVAATAGSLATSLATSIGLGAASAAQIGSSVALAVQAAVGAAVTWALSKTGVVQWLDAEGLGDVMAAAEAPKLEANAAAVLQHLKSGGSSSAADNVRRHLAT